VGFGSTGPKVVCRSIGDPVVRRSTGELVVGSLVVGSLVVGSLVVGSLVVGSLVVGSLVVGRAVVGTDVVGAKVRHVPGFRPPQPLRYWNA